MSPGPAADRADVSSAAAVYGAPPLALTAVPAGALQVSPLRPGAAALEDVAPGSLARVVVAAPPGAVERPYQLALALRALEPGGRLTALAPKDKGGARLRGELQGFGCVVEETARRHHRICTCLRPDALAIGSALEAGAPRWVEAISMWSQPGVFSWDRLDPGSALLLQSLPELSGTGADLGCGIGHLARTVLHSPGVRRLALVDVDRRAIAAARRNVEDARAELRWADVVAPSAPPPAGAALAGLDFVVSNPPFHDGGAEDRALGQAFVRSAARSLRKGGVLWMVANRHLPYEAVLAAEFGRVDVRTEGGGFKVFEARR